MTEPLNSQFDKFMDVLVDELISMSDDQILEGVDADAEKLSGLAILQSANAIAGRRRMEAARAGVAVSRERRGTEGTPIVSVEVARQYILHAANDSRFTLAARAMEELSDDEVLRLYSQMKALEQSNTNDKSSK